MQPHSLFTRAALIAAVTLALVATGLSTATAQAQADPGEPSTSVSCTPGQPISVSAAYTSTHTRDYYAVHFFYDWGADTWDRSNRHQEFSETVRLAEGESHTFAFDTGKTRINSGSIAVFAVDGAGISDGYAAHDEQCRSEVYFNSSEDVWESEAGNDCVNKKVVPFAPYLTFFKRDRFKYTVDGAVVQQRQVNVEFDRDYTITVSPLYPDKNFMMDGTLTFTMRATRWPVPPQNCLRADSKARINAKCNGRVGFFLDNRGIHQRARFTVRVGNRAKQHVLWRGDTKRIVFRNVKKGTRLAVSVAGYRIAVKNVPRC